jgi:Ca2+-binding EF-hand superfamily protein
MTKALVTLALMGLLASAAQVSSAQQEEAAQQPGQEQRPSGDDVFTGLDTDRDGMLTEEEFSRAFAPTATDDDKKKMFTTWDTDGDNKISKQEFLAKY